MPALRASSVAPPTNHDGRVRREAGAESTDVPVKIIRRQTGWRFLNFRELWRHRELLYFLVWRDIKVRYKQTVLGATWAVLQPLATMLVFSFFFSKMGVPPTDDQVPYRLFVFAGLIPWFFFSNAISSASQSVVGNSQLVTKIYFPRLLIPMGPVGACVLDLVISFSILLVMMAYYGVSPGWGLLVLPLLALGLMIAAIGVGTLLCALTVAYRDFRYIVPFMVQLWMFLTPTIYMQADTLLSSRWQWLLPLNPAYGLIRNFQLALLYGRWDAYSLVVSLAVSLTFLVTGAFYFRRVERRFADII